jgi:hypothetical protein
MNSNFICMLENIVDLVDALLSNISLTNWIIDQLDKPIKIIFNWSCSPIKSSFLLSTMIYLCSFLILNFR